MKNAVLRKGLSIASYLFVINDKVVLIEQELFWEKCGGKQFVRPGHETLRGDRRVNFMTIEDKCEKHGVLINDNSASATKTPNKGEEVGGTLNHLVWGIREPENDSRRAMKVTDTPVIGISSKERFLDLELLKDWQPF